MIHLRLLTLAVALLAFVPPAAADDAELFKALRSPGHFGLMRHSTAPGSDDPPNFQLRDCATQRNLSAEGRTRAAAIGARLRANGLGQARVASSQWCRCLDTARLLGLGAVEDAPAFNTLLSYAGPAAGTTAAARDWIQRQELRTPLIVVTHNVNINGLVSTHTEEGDIVVVERATSGALRVLGTIRAQ